MNNTLRQLTACLCAFAVAACSTITSHPLTSQAIVQIGVGRFLANNPRHAPRVAEIAGQIEIQAGAVEVLTVAALRERLEKEIRWDSLTPIEKQFVRDLLAELISDLTRRLGIGELKPEDRLIVSTVARWIREAAEAAQSNP